MKYWINAERPGRHRSFLPMFGVERDGSIQQQLGFACVLEMARIHQRLLHRGKIVRIRIETCANALDVARAAKNLSVRGRRPRRWKRSIRTLARAAMSPSHIDGATNAPASSSELGACRAREVLLANWVEAIAVGTGSHPEQPAVVFIRLPEQ